MQDDLESAQGEPDDSLRDESGPLYLHDYTERPRRTDGHRSPLEERRRRLIALGLSGVVALLAGLYLFGIAADPFTAETTREYESMRMEGTVISILGLILIALSLAGLIFRPVTNA